jgi:hypothetical protein
VVEVAAVLVSTAGGGDRDSPESSAAGRVQVQGESKARQGKTGQGRAG